MRILQVVHRFLPRYPAGTEVYTGRLGLGLAERGHAVAIFTGDPEANNTYSYEWENLPVQAVPWRSGGPARPIATFLAGFANAAVETHFANYCATFQPEVIHIHHLLGLSPRLPTIARRHGAGVVITLHDFWFRCSNTLLFRYDGQLCPGPELGYHCAGCALQRLGREPNPIVMAAAAPVFVARTATLREVLRKADCIIAPSNVTARGFAGDTALAERLVTLPHGVAPPTSEPNEPRTLEVRPLRYAYVGQLIRSKGVHVIVQAFSTLPPGDEELHLYGDLTPDPAYTDELRHLATRPGVIFHGRVENRKIMDALTTIDMLLVPSLCYEAYSVNVDEALSAGVPVLVSSHSAPAERVQPEVNGLLAAPGDPAAWLRQMQRVRDEAGLLGQLRAGIRPPKTTTAHAEEIEAIYRQVLRRPA